MREQIAAHIKEILSTDEAWSLLADGDWMAGGCSMVAFALQRLLPDAEVVAVGRRGIPDHLQLRITLDNGEKVHVDASGLHPEGKVVKEYRNSFYEEGEVCIQRLPPYEDLKEWGMYTPRDREVIGLSTLLDPLRRPLSEIIANGYKEQPNPKRGEI